MSIKFVLMPSQTALIMTAVHVGAYTEIGQNRTVDDFVGFVTVSRLPVSTYVGKALSLCIV